MLPFCYSSDSISEQTQTKKTTHPPETVMVTGGCCSYNYFFPTRINKSNFASVKWNLWRRIWKYNFIRPWKVDFNVGFWIILLPCFILFLKVFFWESFSKSSSKMSSSSLNLNNLTQSYVIYDTLSTLRRTCFHRYVFHFANSRFSLLRQKSHYQLKSTFHIHQKLSILFF